MKTGIVILAAGESARMGESKQLLELNGKTLLGRTIDTALEVPEATVAVVLGARADRIRERLDETRVRIVENPDWQSGMGGSIRTGVKALLAEDPELAAVMILTCDQPLLTSTVLFKLVSSHQQAKHPIVASGYDDTLGVPALFDRALFPELLALNGSIGARKIIMNHGDQVAGIPFPDGAIDIDTPADYEQLCELQATTNV